MMHENHHSFTGHSPQFPRKKYSLLIILTVLLSLLAVWGMVSAETTTTQKAIDASEGNIWTNWGATSYALADDGNTLWIGAAGSVIKWDKTAQTYERIGTMDGLPHRQIFAIAVDNAGNRWFGGDAGLSKLDFEDNWTHYTTENSGLYANRVDAIAVNSEGTLWLRHGLADSWITEFTFEEEWFVHPDRESAI
ncbi:MAG: hypothetical protein KAG66_18560, partial [Methylococcales bacterium]|nr:hypothetical protein [Methylococcales bacterium]